MTPSKTGEFIRGPVLPRPEYLASPLERRSRCVFLSREDLGDNIPRFVSLSPSPDGSRKKDNFFPPLKISLKCFEDKILSSVDPVVSVKKCTCPPSEKESCWTSYSVSILLNTKAKKASAPPSSNGVQFLFRSQVPLSAIKALNVDISYAPKRSALNFFMASVWDQRSCSRKLKYGTPFLLLPLRDLSECPNLKSIKPGSPIPVQSVKLVPSSTRLVRVRGGGSRAMFRAVFSKENRIEDEQVGVAFLSRWGVSRKQLKRTVSEGSGMNRKLSSVKSANKVRTTTLKRVGDYLEDTGWVLVGHPSAAKEA